MAVNQPTAVPVAVSDKARQIAEKWQRKTTTVGVTKYNYFAGNATQYVDLWASGIYRAFGVQPGPTVRNLYVEGVREGVNKYREKVSDPAVKEKYIAKVILGLTK